MDLAVNTNVKNSDTTYGIMFQTILNSPSQGAENKAWADYLSTFFDYNKDNENIMLSIAKNSLSRPVSKLLIPVNISSWQCFQNGYRTK